MNDHDLYVPHEKLDCYRLAEEAARWVANATFRRGDEEYPCDTSYAPGRARTPANRGSSAER